MTSDQRKSNDRRPAAGARTTAKSQTASKPRTSNSTTGRQSTAHRRSVSNEGKSGTTRGKSEGRGKKLNNGSGKKDSTQYELQNEITLMITLVVSILLLLSDFKLGGAVGNAVNGVMFGLFGVLAYLFPILLFLGVAFFLANRGNRNLPFKLFYIAGMFLMLLSLAQLMTNYLPAQWEATTENPYIRPSQYYSLSKQYRKGGGVLGGFICFLFEPLFGKAGSYVTVIALFLVFFMLFSRKAIFQWIAKAGKNRYALHKVHAMERREIFEEKQAERERLIEEKQKELSERRAKTYLLSEEEKFKANPEGKEERRKKNTVSSKSPRPDFEKMEIDPLTGEYVYAKQETFSTGKEKLWIDEKPVTEEVQKPEERSFFMGNRKKENESRNSFGFLSGEKSFPGNGAEPKTEPLRREPTVAEQLMKLGGPSDRATSGGQALWESTIPEAQKNETEIKPVSFREEQKIPEPVFEAGMDGNGVEKPIEPTVSRSTERKSSSQNAPVKKNSDDVTIPELPVNGEPEPSVKKYVYPPVDLLSKPKGMKVVSEHDLHETAMKLQTTLDSFGVHVTVTNVSCGPAVTRYELLPEQGVKVSKITSLADDIKLNLAAADVRIEAPIPGKAAVGIEVPNKENSMVLLRELLESKEFQAHPSKVAFAVGKDIGGQTVVTDIAKMPHLLIAGATGSGKSVCINTLIMSIIYKADPAEVKMIMVDPKVVELSVYNGIPHLMIPVVTDPKKASAALNWAVMEMTDRYQKFAELSVRDIKGYNERVENAKKEGLEEEKYKHLPQIIIIVDELADLMMVAPGEVEDSICRLAQLARAAGLHLVIATQRPSVNVITGLIKANIPSRIAFAVSSAIDSRTILDGSGAEKLLGKGDMLFFPSGYSKPIRVQGAFVSDHEVSAVVDFLKEQNEGAVYSSEVSEKITSAAVKSEDSAGGNASDGNDEFFGDAGKLIIEKDKASIGMLQRAYKIGFNRAARIMDQLCEAGVVGPEEGTKPRKVLMTEEEFNAYLGNGV